MAYSHTPRFAPEARLTAEGALPVGQTSPEPTGAHNWSLSWRGAIPAEQGTPPLRTGGIVVDMRQRHTRGICRVTSGDQIQQSGIAGSDKQFWQCTQVTRGESN